MRFKHVIFVMALVMVWSTQSPVTQAGTLEQDAAILEGLTWYSEEYPPYNFDQDGQVAGISVDILMAAFKKLGGTIAPTDITIAPWNRSYKFILHKPGTALFVMTYTPERQQVMKFAGPIVPTVISLIARKDKGHVVEREADIAKLRIGTVREDIGDQLIHKIAPAQTKITRKNSLKQLLYLLDTGRVDALAYEWSVFQFAAKKTGRPPGDYEDIFVLKAGELGFVFHKSTNAAAIARLQQAVDELRQSGFIQAVIDQDAK